VEFARAHNKDPRFSFEQGDARVLPFADNSRNNGRPHAGPTGPIAPNGRPDHSFDIPGP